MARKQSLHAAAVPRKYSITRIYWVGLVLLAAVPTLLLGYLWVSDQYRSFQEQSAALRQNFFETHRQFLRREAAEATDYIAFKNGEIDQRLLSELKKYVGNALLALEAQRIASDGEPTQRQRERVRQLLGAARFGGGSDHFFILDDDGSALLMQIRADMGGLHFVPALMQQARRSGDASVSVWLPKPGTVPGTFSAQVYLRFYPALKIYVGAIGYEEDVVAVTQGEVLTRFRGQAVANGVAMSVVSFDGRILMDNSDATREGASIRTLHDADGQPIAPPILAAIHAPDGVLVESRWEIGDNKAGENKQSRRYLSYAQAYPGWRWVTVATFPVNDLEQQIENQRLDMRQRVQRRIAYVGLIVVALLIIATLIAQRLAAETRRVLRQFNQFFAESNRQNVRIDVAQVNLLEFEPLAVDANRMLEYRIGVERELIAARISAEEANQAKSQFLSTMSHELRTPLNGVLGYAQILMRDPALTVEQHRHLTAIQSCGEHLLTLINDVLDLAKIESGALEVANRDCHLYTLLEGTSDIVRGKAEAKGLAFALEIAPGLPQHVWIDEVKLRQILINLLGNAVKFTDSGSVTLGAGISADGTHLAFDVSDTGIGIAQDRLAEIFQPFRQIDASGGGTGLGLAISQRVTQAMGGELTVESALGAGSCFRLMLPLVRAAQIREIAPRESIPDGFELRPTRLTVMVADDNPDNRLVMAGLLRSAGADTIEAENGVDVLAKLRAHKVPLVLMDVRMPVMDGIEATRQIKLDPDLRDIVVIAVSASVFPEVIEQMRAAGGDDFINKPVHLSELLEKIAQHLGVALRTQTFSGNRTDIAIELLHPSVRGALRSAIAEGDLEAMYAALKVAETEGSEFGAGGEVARRLRILLDNFEIEVVRDLLAQGVERA